MLRRLTGARRLAAQWIAECNEVQDRLNKTQRRLRSLQRQFESVSRTMVEDLEQAAAVSSRNEAALEALRQENQVLSDVLVPSLTAAHKLLLQRYEAETAIQVRRQVAAGPE